MKKDLAHNLIYQVSKGDIYQVRLLLEEGANPDESDGTALRCAISNDDVPVAVLLLNWGANPNAHAKDKETPFDYAVEQHNKQMIALLLDAGADATVGANAAVEANAAIEAGDKLGNSVQNYLCPESEKYDMEGLHLHSAAYTDDASLFFATFHSKKCVEICRYMKTALIWAARFGYAKIVPGLLDITNNINSRDWKDRTALCWAARNSHLDVVEVLLNHGVYVHAKDQHGMNALSWAISRNLAVKDERLKTYHALKQNDLLPHVRASLAEAHKLWELKIACTSQIIHTLARRGANTHTEDDIDKVASTVRAAIQPPSTSRIISINSIKGYAIPVPPPAPKVFALDMDSVRQKIAETAQVQELLQAQFVEDEVTPAIVTVTPAPADASEEANETNLFKNLDTQHSALLKWLMKKPIWKRQDVDAVAKPLELMTSGALERLNEMALEMGEDNIFEGDDPIYVDIALARELLL